MKQLRYIQNIFLILSRYSWRYFLLILLLIVNSLLHLNSLSESYRRQQKAHHRITDKLVVIEKKLVARASHVQSQRRDKGLHPGLTTSATFGPTKRTCNYAVP